MLLGGPIRHTQHEYTWASTAKAALSPRSARTVKMLERNVYVEGPVVLDRWWKTCFVFWWLLTLEKCKITVKDSRCAGCAGRVVLKAWKHDWPIWTVSSWSSKSKPHLFGQLMIYPPSKAKKKIWNETIIIYCPVQLNLNLNNVSIDRDGEAWRVPMPGVGRGLGGGRVALIWCI